MCEAPTEMHCSGKIIHHGNPVVFYSTNLLFIEAQPEESHCRETEQTAPFAVCEVIGDKLNVLTKAKNLRLKIENV